MRRRLVLNNAALTVANMAQLNSITYTSNADQAAILR